VGEGEIFGREAPNIAEELILVAIGGKDGVFQGGAGANERAGKRG